jgi:hypothetical protein
MVTKVHRRLGVIIACLTLAASSCGIRVPHSDVVAAGNGSVGSGQGSGTPSGTGGGLSGTGGDSPGSTSVSGAGGAGGGGSYTSGASAGNVGGATGGSAQGGSSSSPLGSHGVANSTTGSGSRGTHPAGWVPAAPGTHGVTDTTIQVGVWTLDSSAASAAVAAVSGQPGAFNGLDYSKAAQAVADYVNRHGGIAGRQVSLVNFQLGAQGAASQAGEDQSYQQGCADWTQDHHVFAIASFGGEGLSCALQSNTVLVSDLTNSGVSVSNTSYQQTHDLWYGPSLLSTERQGRNVVDGLWKQGFFPSGTKVGILIEDSAQARDGVSNGMLPALASHGIDPKSVTQIVYPYWSQAAWNTYAFQLESAGVNRILWSKESYGPFPVELMMRAADSQRFYPRWGLASDTEFFAGGDLGWPQTEMENTQGIGWVPELDVGDTTYAGSSSGKTCLQITHDTGQTGAFIYCEYLFFLKDALDHATIVSNAGMAASVARLQTSYVSVANLLGRSYFDASHPDGPSVYQGIIYSPACSPGKVSCFRYSGPVQTFEP